MAFKIAIASGKGGTGKTTLSVNLFNSLNKAFCNKVQLVDCDVEEPNDFLFFQNAITKSIDKVYQFIPEVDNRDCTFCRKCVEYCEFNAIVVIPHVEFAEVNSNLCHSCGACLVACSKNAITEKKEEIGEVTSYNLGIGFGLLEGKLRIGSAMQTMLIKELKKDVSSDSEIIIFDAPPGTSCPVVQTVSDADYIILVSEPTPFGLHDLKLMVELTREINKPFGVVINKSGLGNNEIYEYLDTEGIEILGEIPFNKKYASNYAQGRLLNDAPLEISESILRISKNVERRIIVYEGDNYFKW